MDRAEFLAAYDEHLRTQTEMRGAEKTARLGPLWLAVFPDGDGFITYQDLSDTPATEYRALVGEALRRFEPDDSLRQVEWKTRGHDDAPGLHGALVANGFEPDELESVMIGDLRGLTAEVDLPPGVIIRRVHRESDVRAVSALIDLVFDGVAWEASADALVRRLATDSDVELWAAEVEGELVSAGRLELVGGTPFAGLWGGVTKPEWRGRGIYRAVTAARARSALAHGKTLAQSDSTEFSRPILERAGLVKVSTTTPYRWKR